MENRVLVVDDNEFILSLISQILNSQGYDVETSTRAYGIVDRIHAFHPNLILLDVELPDGDGRDLCRMIKQSKEMQHIAVVMCTGLDELNDFLLQQPHPDAILHKPFDMNQLIHVVEENLPLAA
jgi:DNA-binding response OmpR family regulator